MLEISGLSFAYDKKIILKEIDLKANKGEFITLLGANGSGKTTFLKCIQGLLKPLAGKIAADGENIKQLGKKETAQKIAVVPQEYQNVFDHQVIEMVVMGINPWLSFGQQPSDAEYTRALNILKELNIAELYNKNFNKISGGERQLVLIGRALMQQSDIMLLDEPNSHLDFKNMHLIMEMMSSLKDKDKIVISAMHNPNLAYKYSDKIMIINQGKVTAFGSTEEVMTAENIAAAYDMDIAKVRDGILSFSSRAKLKKEA